MRPILTTLTLICLIIAPITNTVGLNLPNQPQTVPELSIIPHAPILNNKAYVLLDPKTQQVIASQHMNKKIQPASLTKLMSLFIVAHALTNKQIHLNDPVLISKNAWHAEGSRMFLKPGTQVTVKNLISGVAVASGNDATIALAEHIAGTEENFVGMMNQIAKTIGMHHSHFMNSTGLPNKNHYTTAHDLAILASTWINKFPEYYSWFSQKWITYNNIRQPNRNRLLWREKFVDGMKTGHTQSAGYCLIASGKKKQTRFVSVVIGSHSDIARTEQSEQLLNYGFHFFTTKKLITAKQELIHLKTYMGKNKTTLLGPLQNVYVTIPKFSAFKYKSKAIINNRLIAPVKKNQPVGQMAIISKNKEMIKIPLYTLETNDQGGFISTLLDRVQLWLHPISASTNST